MRITITSRHIEIPELLEKMLRSKVERLERFGHKLIALHAIFDRQKYLYTAELTLTGKEIGLVSRAKHSKDLLTCMEQALDKLHVQLTRHEEKKIERLRRRVPRRE